MTILNDMEAVAAPATGVLTVSYTELTQEVGDSLGMGRSGWTSLEQTRLDSIVQSGLRQVYYAEKSPGMAYQWSFMRPEATIETTAEYTTGTIEVASGVVTLTTGTWPSWAAEGELHISSQAYSVDTRDSNTQITLDDTSATAAAGTSYSLARPAYDLPEGFDGSFDGDLHYKLSNNTLWCPIRMISPEMLRNKKQTYSGSDRPTCASIQPKTFDPTVGQRWQIIFHPTPNAAYTLYGRYKVRPAMLSGTNLYPLGGSALAEVILESCLAVAEKRFIEDSTIHQKEFQRLLLQAIGNDADAFSTPNLGYNSDNSERSGGGVRYHDNAIHSYMGVVYRDVNP